jgi:hypothetical protein
VSGTADRAIATAIQTATARLDLRVIRPAVQSQLAGHGLPLPSDDAIRTAYALVAAARAGVPTEGEALRWLASPPRAQYSPTLRRTLGLARALVSAVQRFVPTHRVTINRTIRR